MTTRKSFCEMQKPPTTTRFAAATAFATATLAVILVWAPAKGFADTAPEWLRAAAHETLPEYPQDTVAVMLRNEQQTTVRANGDIETRYRGAYKLLRPEARKDYS